MERDEKRRDGRREGEQEKSSEERRDAVVSVIIHLSVFSNTSLSPPSSPPRDIKRLVLTLDETQLTLDRCKSLIDNSPTAEEVDMVKVRTARGN